MQRIATLFILVFILVSTFSLSLQTVYKNSFCQDTKDYLSIAGKSITVCGKTCDFRYVGSQKSDSDAAFTFNLNAAPLYFEAIEPIQIYAFVPKNHPFDREWTGYQFFVAPNSGQPPQAVA